MAIGRRIGTFNLKELVVLGRVFLRHPLYLFPTYKATRKAVAISDRLYGNLHHEDNRANAFRHALWNYLICKHCLPVAGSPEKAVSWSKRVTDLHERLSPNEGLAKKMDLHNNRIGRELFISSYKQNEEFMPVLQLKAREAVKVANVADIEIQKKNLVFIEDLKVL